MVIIGYKHCEGDPQLNCTLFTHITPGFSLQLKLLMMLSIPVLCCAGLIYGAEAHLVANLTLNGKYHLVVFGEHFSARQLQS